jgi:surface protein
MIIGLGIGLGFQFKDALDALARYPSGGLIAEDKANFENLTGTTTTGDVTISNGAAVFGGTAISRVTFTGLTVPSGTWWAHAIMSEFEPGSSKVRGLSSTYDPLPLRARGFHQVYQVPALLNSTSLDFLASSNFDGTLERVQLFDQTAALAAPWDIFILAGQSNMAATTAGLPLDKDQDAWTDQRLLYFPGDTTAAFNTVKDSIDAARGPLVAASISGGAFLADPANSGVSPGLRYGQRIVQSTPAGRSVVLVQCAISGTSLEGADAAWNPAGNTGDGALAYDAMLARVAAVLAAAPAGSTIKEVVWAQGEGDTSSDMSSYPASWATMRSAAETAWGQGQVPWVILLGPPDATRSNQDEFRRVQKAMATGSGGAEAQPQCYVVDRPAGYMEDSTHVNAAGNRIAGGRLASRYIASEAAIIEVTDFVWTVATTTASETFTIPCQDVGVFDAAVDWGDGSSSAITAFNDADLVHTYASAGDHQIRISGTFPNILFENSGDKLKVKSVANLGTVGWSWLYRAFYGCSNMTSFVSGDTDTSAVTTMSQMFRSCSSLATLDVTSFDTSAATSMDFMFIGCSSLASLDVTNFDTSAVIDMGSMFRDCSSLTTLDLTSFNTSIVTDMALMFRDCSALTTLDVTNFDTSAVTNMGFMFRGCSSITTLDVTNFDTSAVTDMGSMFIGCSTLAALDVTSFDTSAVKDMDLMFRNCSSLATLDLTSFNTSIVRDMFQMFRDCTSLADIVGVQSFNITGLNSTGSLSEFCSGVTLPTSRYNSLLINWGAQNPFDGMSPNFGSSTYTAGGLAAAGRTKLISTDGWTITDGGTA